MAERGAASRIVDVPRRGHTDLLVRGNVVRDVDQKALRAGLDIWRLFRAVKAVKRAARLRGEPPYQRAVRSPNLRRQSQSHRKSDGYGWGCFHAPSVTHDARLLWVPLVSANTTEGYCA